ncbi:hypothetical protein BC936DRAFT_145343 [Jimgerdemannia flammicorona]|uniref:Uncharacterized protein n=1 Tax=Jimgerdemannia flammicorona TaxID=994334 RepID=A0A433DA79_9FUNG|nr:hypothetical protein BC936DRAFT_145343 [Jimgerdemannia flammicorona]
MLQFSVVISITCSCHWRTPRTQPRTIHDLAFPFAMAQCVISGEIYLQASANRRAVRRHLKPKSDKPEGMKVDGIFQSPVGLEMGFVEMSGGHQTNDQPCYLKDHVRGFRGQCDLLDDAAAKYVASGYHIMRHLRTWFLHTHGKWGMDLPVKCVYRMFLLGTFQFPICWEEHDQLLRGLPVLWALAMSLEVSRNTLDKMKRLNCASGYLQTKKSESLTNYIGTKMETPAKPKGKTSRIIKPIIEGSSSPSEASAHSD